MMPVSIGVTLRWIAAALAVVAAAAAVAMGLTQLVLSPSRRDLIELGLYLAFFGFVSIAIGALVVFAIDRRIGRSLAWRFVAVSLVTCGIIVVNVLVLARLMFISTNHDLQVVLATVVFGAIVAVAFAAWASRMTTARLSAINAGVRNLAAGERHTGLPTDGNDEVAMLARDVNHLASRLAEAEASRTALDEERRALTAAISHDLRTPLSTIRAMIDALEDDVVHDPAEVKRYLVTMRRDVERLNRMIDDLFELAQIDAGAMQLRMQPIAVEEVAAEVVDAMRARAERQGVKLNLRMAPGLPRVAADGDRLERAIANLLRNALEHTPAGGDVTVTVQSRGDEVAVSISDTGEGIGAQDIPQIWTRFYRADTARARTDGSDGAGLGLAITKGIVELHGGRVDAKSSRGQGATFVLSLPVSTSNGGVE
jgi:signal transduction histidine kinase